MGDHTSRLRQRLLQNADQLREQVDFFLDERGPLIRGSFGTRSRVCGKPGCHCAQGEKHVSKYLTATDGGRLRQVHVPAGDEQLVSNGVGRYRRFRRMRKRLEKLGALLLQLVDDLGRSLRTPYPPGDPLPPAARRGRKAGHARRKS